jgi:membrane dipeptidase
MTFEPTDFATLKRWPSGARLDEEIQIDGWMAPFEPGTAASYFALVSAAACCVGCLPRDARSRIEVFAAVPVAITDERVRLVGRLRVLQDDDPSGWKFQLHDARMRRRPRAPDARFTRRHALRTLAWAAAAAQQACTSAPTRLLATPASASAPSPASDESRALLDAMVSVDIHSHAGHILGLDRVEHGGRFAPVAEPMREGGMAVLCLAIVCDSPTHRVTAEKRIRPFRDPQPGELQAYGEESFRRVHELARVQGLRIVRSARDLDAARSAAPAIIVTAEGGDFLEGHADRVDDAYERWALRHLQLTHYRVNELGDIQTEPPVHGGLTQAGAEVIRRCNQLGIVVDVAHGTYDLVRQAASVTDKPLVLSHTSLAAAARPHSRLIAPDHARAIAGTGGVIGIWPPASIFPDLAALAVGIARMADVVGVEHVALGSDMNGLVGPSTFASYRELPALADALLQHGFEPEDVQRILGGNYVRVFRASLGDGAAPSQAAVSGGAT